MKERIMEQSKIETFMSTMDKKFPSRSLMAVRSQLEQLDDRKLILLQSLPKIKFQ